MALQSNASVIRRFTSEFINTSSPTLATELIAPDAVFHAPTDRYGVWPAAVRAAAAHGVPGYLLRFPDWKAAAWCLDRGLPIVASVRFSPGELTNAPIPETTGHLVVITGLHDDDVLVNDPAAPSAESVPCRYRRDEFSRVWLERSGVGYVFFPPARALLGHTPRGGSGARARGASRDADAARGAHGRGGDRRARTRARARRRARRR